MAISRGLQLTVGDLPLGKDGGEEQDGPVEQGREEERGREESEGEKTVKTEQQVTASPAASKIGK